MTLIGSTLTPLCAIFDEICSKVPRTLYGNIYKSEEHFYHQCIRESSKLLHIRIKCGKMLNYCHQKIFIGDFCLYAGIQSMMQPSAPLARRATLMAMSTPSSTSISAATTCSSTATSDIDLCKRRAAAHSTQLLQRQIYASCSDRAAKLLTNSWIMKT